MRKKKKIRRNKDKAPSQSIEEFARSAARLVAQMVKMAGENNCIQRANDAFKEELQENLPQHQRNQIQNLMNECYQEFNIRGSEKSGGENYAQTDPAISECPEPVPKEVEDSVATINDPNSENFTNYAEFEVPSLYGYGVKQSEAPSKYLIDELLQRGIYTKRQIVEVTGFHPDTVRKRITYIQKHIPQIAIHKNTQGSMEPVLRAEPVE